MNTRGHAQQVYVFVVLLLLPVHQRQECRMHYCENAPSLY